MMPRDPATQELKDRLSELSQRRFKEGMAPADFQHMLRTILATRDGSGEPVDADAAPPFGEALKQASSGAEPRWLVAGVAVGAVIVVAGLLFWAYRSGLFGAAS